MAICSPDPTTNAKTSNSEFTPMPKFQILNLHQSDFFIAQNVKSHQVKTVLNYIKPIIYFKKRHLCGEVGELAGDVPYFHNELIKLPATDDIV